MRAAVMVPHPDVPHCFLLTPYDLIIIRSPGGGYPVKILSVSNTSGSVCVRVQSVMISHSSVS